MSWSYPILYRHILDVHNCALQVLGAATVRFFHFRWLCAEILLFDPPPLVPWSRPTFAWGKTSIARFSLQASIRSGADSHRFLMTFVLTCWRLPKPTAGFHSFGAPSGFPTEVAETPFEAVRLPCAEEGTPPSQHCTLVDIRHQAPHADTDITSTASPTADHVLISHTFAPGLVRPVLAQFSSRLCSLVATLPHEDLGRLCDVLPDSHGLRYLNLTSTTATTPLPPGLICHLTPLVSLVLCNILLTWKPQKSLFTLTTLSISGYFKPPMSLGFEYKISEFFEILLCTPRLRHLRLSGIGPTIYDVTPGWVVPLEFLETLCLHHCQLQAEMLHHLSLSLDLREISIHTHIRSVLLNVGVMSCVTPREWLFNPFRVDVYQEGRDRCRLLFVGTRCWRNNGDDLAEIPVMTLEVSVTNTTRGLDATFTGRCIKSFQTLSTANIREITIHAYRHPRRHAGDHLHNLLRSLSALRKLVLKGCNETPFYEALTRVAIKGRLPVVCPHLAVVEIDPIVEFRRHLGYQAPPCSKLVTDLSTLTRKRKGHGAPLKRLKVVFPAECRVEARYVEKLIFDLGMWTVIRVRVA